jgi:hypothetical protein
MYPCSSSASLSTNSLRSTSAAHSLTPTSAARPSHGTRRRRKRSATRAPESGGAGGATSIVGGGRGSRESSQSRRRPGVVGVTAETAATGRRRNARAPADWRSQTTRAERPRSESDSLTTKSYRIMTYSVYYANYYKMNTIILLSS